MKSPGSIPGGVTVSTPENSSGSGPGTEQVSVSAHMEVRRPLPGDAIELRCGRHWVQSLVLATFPGAEPFRFEARGMVGVRDLFVSGYGEEWRWPEGAVRAGEAAPVSPAGKGLPEQFCTYCPEVLAPGDDVVPAGKSGARAHRRCMEEVEAAADLTGEGFEFDARLCAYCGQLVAAGGVEQPGGRLAHVGCDRDALDRSDRAPWGDQGRAYGFPKSATIRELDAEIMEARAKFPGNRFLLAALTEEVGEVARAFLQRRPPDEIRREALQVACVAIRIYEEGDPSFADITAEESKP